MSETRNGKCLCGAVKVEINLREDNAELHACHCGMCRSWSGSALIGMAVKPDDIRIEGPVRSRASSDWAARDWCDTCGSTLWYRLTVPGHEFYHVSAGLFDNAADLPLTKEIFIDRKPSGYAFAGDHELKTQAEMEAIFASFGKETGQ
ncbi:GFA family protein [Sulfitobacter aestuarii]|uniref:GFA family protein n=1 Tax=Sulfitobacter aestuarii TaxID=2161676 RepID=A0ABW5TZD1_9RHOB